MHASTAQDFDMDGRVKPGHDKFGLLSKPTLHPILDQVMRDRDGDG